MDYTIKSLRDELYQKVFEVYDVFKDFFGERNVDLQGVMNDDDFKMYLSSVRCVDDVYDISDSRMNSLKSIINSLIENLFILVYWPRVTVTNENNRSVVIQDLYAKVNLTLEGTIPYECRGFLLNRATYPLDQYSSNYMHSHICNIPKGDFSAFQSPCLGRGPINQTIVSLKSDFDETTWMLFCQELSMYVTVESIQGVPYHYLERIGSYANESTYNNFDNDVYSSSVDRAVRNLTIERLQEFLPWYLENGHVAINFKNGLYCVGMTPYQYMLDVSNAFIDFCNKKAEEGVAVPVQGYYDNGVLCSLFVVNEKFYNSARNNEQPNINGVIGQHVCWFKGKDIKLNILTNAQDESQPESVTLLNKGIALIILKTILNRLNYGITTTSTREEASSQTDKRVFII